MVCDALFYSQITHIIHSIATLVELLKIPIQAYYEACFTDWKSCWHSCVGVERDYFEGNDVLSDEE